MTAIAINNVVSDQCSGRVGTGNDGRRSIGIIVENDAITVGVPAVRVLVVRALVHFPDNDVVGDYQMQSIIRVRALIYVVGNPAGPTVILGDIRIGTGRNVAVVGDDIVIGGDGNGVLRPDCGTAGVADDVFVKTPRGVSPPEKTIKSLPLAVHGQAQKLQKGRR